MLMGKNAYEIRLDVIKLAQELLVNNAEASRDSLTIRARESKAFAESQEYITSINATNISSYEVIKEATSMYAFINKK